MFLQISVMISAPLCTFRPISPFRTFSGLQEADFYSLTLVAVERQESLANRKKKEMEGGKRAQECLPFCSVSVPALTFLTQANSTSTIAPVYGPYSTATVPGSLIYVLLPFAGSSGLRSLLLPVKEDRRTNYLGLPAAPSCSLFILPQILFSTKAKDEQVESPAELSSACLVNSSEQIWTFLSQRKG